MKIRPLLSSVFCVVCFTLLSACDSEPMATMGGAENVSALQTLTATTMSYSETPGASQTQSAVTTPSPTRPAVNLIKTPTPLSPAMTASVVLESAKFQLAYIKESREGLELVFADPVGMGRQKILLPETGDRVVADIEGLSPNGEYFAYHSGEMGSGGGNVVLHIIRLQDEEEVATIPVITDDLVQQMENLGELLASDPPQSLIETYHGPILAEDITSEGLFAMGAGIRSLDWSPDSTLLAFAAQINGPTSDLYTYEVSSGTITQLTSGPTQVQFVKWSPNGEWIAHGSTFWVGMGNPEIFNFVSADGTNIFSISTGANVNDGWYGSEIFLLAHAANVQGKFKLESVSLETQRVNNLWGYSYGSYVLDLSIGKMLVFAYPFGLDDEGNLRGPDEGIHLVDFNDGSIQAIELDNPGNITSWRRAGEFALLGIDGDLKGMDNNGRIRLLVEAAKLLAPTSPDGNWVMYSKQGVEGIRIWNVETDQEVSLPETSVPCITWKPDSTGFVYKLDDRVYFNDLSGEGSTIVDQKTVGSWGDCELKWVSVK